MAKNNKSQPDRKKLNAALAQIEKNFGKGTVIKMGDKSHGKIETVSSGSMSIDIALGGGIPKGRIVEIYGPESSGKTTLCLHAVAEFQKEGGAVAFVDAEHALDPEYARKIGVNIDEMFLSQPDSGEQALEVVEALVRSEEISLIVVDSVAALTPQAELEGAMGDATMGLHARLMSQAMRKLTGISHKTNTTIIFINQLRSKIGVIYGSPEVTTGGNALKFYASLRIDVRKGVRIEEGTKENKEALGSIMKLKVVKNKIAPPFKTTEVDIFFNEGISKAGDLITVGVKYGVIQKSGSFYSYGETKLGQGRNNSISFLKENPVVQGKIAEEIKSNAK